MESLPIDMKWKELSWWDAGPTMWRWPSRSNLTLRSPNLPHFETVHMITLHLFKLGSPHLDQKMQNTSVKITNIFGKWLSMTLKVKFNLKSQNLIIACFVHQRYTTNPPEIMHKSDDYLDCFTVPTVSQSPSFASTFLSKGIIWNVNCALAKASIFNTLTDVLVKLSMILRQKLSQPWGWVGLWGFLWWTPSAKKKDQCRVSSGWSSTWFHSNAGLSSTQYEQIPIIFGVWPFWLTPFFFSCDQAL